MAVRVLREGPAKITKSMIDATWRRRAEGQRIMVGDLDCRGLALVVNPTGMTWRFDYKPRGLDPATGKRFSTRSVTIGNPATHTPEEARAAANVFKGQAKSGVDPADTRRAKIAASAVRRGQTLNRLLAEYATVLPNRPKMRGAGKLSPRALAEETANARAAVAAMNGGEKPVSEIVVADVRAMLRSSANLPAAALHRFGALSRFLDWCRDEDLISVNPCSLLPKPSRPKPVAARQEYLSADSLGTLWKAAGNAEGLEVIQRDFIRFLIAVPCRRNEAATLDWLHLDLVAGEWRQPAALTKNGDAHKLHLPPLALDLLRSRCVAMGMPKSGLVFPAPRSGIKITAFSAIKRAMDRAAPEITGWRLHDCRRSFASALGEAGVAEPVVDAVLNHRQSATRGGVLGVYQRAQRWPEQVRAMEVWGNLLAAAIEGRELMGDKVARLVKVG